ncbi:class I SAM-dependent methyltransferase [Nitrospirillum iridis]|uniref:Ubiquinone/menaquinone biosynthesis C-methylase UbiE n=1 Tax=Nitrospirillum iridis TaxID=765888 RepID=A0A7X0AXL7_9PROT|nr:class I SAM-dependent methyltransferase [Nitrospirillum iridis]MBB6251201.1 ubiquinone/menaquinone biosynthesis C-methylase UbiE [Nitrospirillum iridis]
MTAWAMLGRQLRHPTGWTGRVVGHLMRRINAGPNRLAIDALRLAPGDTVLELGFGPGHGIALAAARVAPAVVHGIDQSAVMMAHARRRNRRDIAAGRVHLHLGRFTALPLATASVDKVLAVNVAYFWSEPGAVLGEVRRVLRPHGVMAVYVTDADAMRRWPFAEAETHRLFDANGLRALMIAGGFAADGIAIRAVPLPGGMTGLVGLARR